MLFKRLYNIEYINVLKYTTINKHIENQDVFLNKYLFTDNHWISYLDGQVIFDNRAMSDKTFS